MLTTLLGFLSILSSWNAISERLKEYYAFFLVLQTGHAGRLHVARFPAVLRVLGNRAGADVFHHRHLGRTSAASTPSIKFVIYTLIGSVLMLLGILTLYFQHYTPVPDVLVRYRRPDEDQRFADAMQWWVFWAFFVGFAVKVPMFPFHTWLPDAHTEAPTAGSVILASVLLKMGTYGFLRFSLPLLPDSAKNPTIINIDGDPLDHRHRLRRAGIADAEGLEEAGGLLVGQPPGLLHAGHFRAESGGHLRARSCSRSITESPPACSS